MIVAVLLVALGAPEPTSRSLLSELERLDRALVTAEQRTIESELRRQQLDDELAATESRIASTAVRQREAFSRYRRRVQALHRMPSGARLILLGASESLGDYLQTSRMLRWVARHDRVLQQSYVADSTRLRALQATLERHKRELATIERRAREQRDEIAARRQERLTLLQSVSTQRELAQRAVGERSEARRELAQMVKRLAPAGPEAVLFSRNRGRLPWPVAGDILRRFGDAVDSEFGTKTPANGVALRAAPGSVVQAVASGEVVYADWLRGYGLLVIVDHGEGYHTVMAHLAKALVTVGIHLEQGASVGLVGETGSFEGPLLYFELRHQGTPLDPLPWLRR